MLSLVLAVGIALYPIQAPGFPCQKVKRFLIENNIQEISILWGTFGNDNSCLKEYIEDNILSGIQVHFSNECCRRNGRCYAGEVAGHLSVDSYNDRLNHSFSRVKPKINKRINKIKALVLSYPEINWIISTGLEDNYTSRAYMRLFKHLKRRLPHVTFSRNPLYPSKYRGLYERHSSWYTGTSIYSNDGFFLCDLDGRYNGDCISTSRMHRVLKEAKRGKSKVFLWWGRIQGLTGSWRKPRHRHFRFSRSDKHILKEIISWKQYLKN